MPRALDLAGQRFGRLVMLSKAESVGRHTRWRAKCICGKERLVITHRVTSVKTKSCGCLVADASRERLTAAWNGKRLTKQERKARNNARALLSYHQNKEAASAKSQQYWRNNRPRLLRRQSTNRATLADGYIKSRTKRLPDKSKKK